MPEEFAVGALSLAFVRTQGFVEAVGFDQFAFFPLPVCAIAGPEIVSRVSHHAGSYRVEFDVTLAGHQVGFFLDQAGSEAAFPQGAAAPVGTVDVLDVRNRGLSPITCYYSYTGQILGFPLPLTINCTLQNVLDNKLPSMFF